MKTIVQTQTGLSKYLLDDAKTVTMSSDKIEVGDPVELIIMDLDSSTATLYEGVTNSPADWSGNKYTFDGSAWTLNASWVEPEIPD